MKVFITAQYHHKNQYSLEQSIKLLDWTLVDNIDDAEVVFSPNSYIDVLKYPEKKFIFGPHFCVFPNNAVRSINNKYNNCIYIQPSQQSIDMWEKHYNITNVPMKVYSFGVDTDKFNQISPIKDRESVFIYYKYRRPDELEYLIDFIRSKDKEPIVFDYTKGYKETEYIQSLHKCKYGLWFGCHESQGFALEEALSCNVPLLVWNIKRNKQQYRDRSEDSCRGD